jgi:putative Holliday junction resolvase
MNLLGVDYGEKRIGIAISHDNGLALPYEIFDNDKSLFKQINKLCESEQIDKVIVGVPYGLHGKDTKQTREVKNFIAVLKPEITLPIVLTDETMSSGAAKQLSEDGKKKDDASEAAVILQGYLDSLA